MNKEKLIKRLKNIKQNANLSPEELDKLAIRLLVEKELKDDDMYWVLATLYQACIGLLEEDEALTWKEKADKISTAEWMIKSTDEQIEKLRKLL